MPRNYKKTTDRAPCADAMKRAVLDVLEGKSLRQSALEHGVRKSTLAGYVKKARDVGVDSPNMEFVPTFRKSQIFSDIMEKELENYLLTSSAMFYGLTPANTKRLAYEYGCQNNIPVPDGWHANKMASKDWFTGFMNRHPSLTIRQPEATSLGRMTSFNKNSLKLFQDKLEEVIRRYNFDIHQIYNIDETGVTTVPKVPKITGKKGMHQVVLKVSRERGELVTQVGIICADGHAVPPVWIFPRRRYDEKRMMKGGLEDGALGLVHPSGWMTGDNFIKVLEHLQKYSFCSTEKKILVIIDNHESHLSVEAIDFCRKNGIVMLTIPPHTSHKLQPLDRSVFGPFKTFFSQEADAWMTKFPGQTLSIYDLPVLCQSAWDRAATPVNIKKGFRCTGIAPFSRTVFNEEDFLAAFVTDRPLDGSSDILMLGKTNQNTSEVIPDSSKDPGPSNHIPAASPGPQTLPSTSTVLPTKHLGISPSDIRPYPKAGERKTSDRGRPRGKCMIVTDTPEKDAIIATKMKKNCQLKSNLKARKRLVYEDCGVKKRKTEHSSSSEDEDLSAICNDEDDDFTDLLCSDSEVEVDLDNIAEGEFIVVQVHGEKESYVRNYVAEIFERCDGGYLVNFMKKLSKTNRFQPSEEETAFVPLCDVIVKLPMARKDTRARFQNMLFFDIDMSSFSLH